MSTSILFLVTTFLTLFLHTFSFEEKDASKPAGNWFQLSNILFMKEFVPTSVLYLLILIFQLYSSLLKCYGFRNL